MYITTEMTKAGYFLFDRKPRERVITMLKYSQIIVLYVENINVLRSHLPYLKHTLKGIEAN